MRGGTANALDGGSARTVGQTRVGGRGGALTQNLARFRHNRSPRNSAVSKRSKYKRTTSVAHTPTSKGNSCAAIPSAQTFRRACAGEDRIASLIHQCYTATCPAETPNATVARRLENTFIYTNR